MLACAGGLCSFHLEGPLEEVCLLGPGAGPGADLYGEPGCLGNCCILVIECAGWGTGAEGGRGPRGKAPCANGCQLDSGRAALARLSAGCKQQLMSVFVVRCLEVRGEL